MQALTSIPSLETLSEGQRAALVRLLADDDPAIFRHIHDSIVAQGPAACGWLEPHRLSDDARTRRRVRAILDRLRADEADSAFLSFCLTQGDRLDVEEGLFLLARTTWPEVNPEGYRALLDGYAGEVRNRVGNTPTPNRMLGTINRLLFIQLGFRGNVADYYAPENSYITQVLDRRTGNPVTLCAVYLGVCRRLELPVAGVGLPGHFVCRFQDATHEIYVDPFNGGRLLTRTDCVHHVVRTNAQFTEESLGPISPRKMLLRSVTNLHQIHEQRKDHARALRMRRYLLALTNKDRLIQKPARD